MNKNKFRYFALKIYNERSNKQVFFSACGPFTKTKERMQKFKKTGD